MTTTISTSVLEAQLDEFEQKLAGQQEYIQTNNLYIALISEFNSSCDLHEYLVVNLPEADNRALSELRRAAADRIDTIFKSTELLDKRPCVKERALDWMAAAITTYADNLVGMTCKVNNQMGATDAH